MWRALLIVVALALLPRPVYAQDDCGIVRSLLVGCDLELQEREAERQHVATMAQIEARATATALDIEARQFLASQQAQTELAQIASRERVDVDRIQAELEAMYARERIAGLQAQTTFSIAALQTDAMIAVANARTREAQANGVIAAAVFGAVLVVAAAFAFAAWRYCRAVEVRAAVHLLPPDDWQRRAVGLLEQRGIPWQLRERRLIAQIDGEWVAVRDE